MSGVEKGSRMLKLVIFDLDGVIINSEPLMRFAFERAYKLIIGDDSPPTETFLEHMGESFPRIMERLGLPATLWAPYRQLCIENLNRVVIFPESRGLFKKLSAHRIKLALLTGKDRARTLQTLDHFNVRHFFDVVVASDQLQYPKPHPEGIYHIMRALNCEADETVMIGDAVNDILCGKQAGVTSIAVTWGIKPERVQTLCRPDYVVHDWESLTEILLQLHKSVPSITGRPMTKESVH